MKYAKISLFILLAVIVPQMALAAWWNPSSWGIWNRIFHFQQQQASATPLFPGLNWSSSTDKTIKEPVAATTINGYEITAAGSINNNTDADKFFSFYDKKLKSAGWIVANNFAADGITGSQVGYKKGNDYIVLSYSITPGKITSGKDEPLQWTCPCKVSYSVFTGKSEVGQCTKDSECPKIYCIKAPCPQYKCINRTCQISKNEVDWKTYTNTKYGFEVKYPSDWKLTDNSGDVQTSDEGLIKNTSLNIESPLRYDLPGYEGFPTNYRILIYKPDGIISSIGDFGSPDPKYGRQSRWNIDVNKAIQESTSEYKIGQQIISSFKLITPQVVGGDKDEHGCIGSAGYTWCEVKQKCLRSWEEKCEITSVPADWETYKNTKFGFEFKYPTDWLLREANPLIGLIILYPKDKSEQAIEKTISTSDEITFGILGSIYSDTVTKKIKIGENDWLSVLTSDSLPMAGGTEKLLEYIGEFSDKYIDVDSGIHNKDLLIKILSTFKFTK